MDLSISCKFSCNYDGCYKAFRRKDRLEVHLRTHTGERPFACEVPGCQSSYARSQHLTRHYDRVHAVPQKLHQKVTCSLCKKDFINRSTLKVHKKACHPPDTSSATVKLYKCSYDGCLESFHKKQQLVVHKLKHDSQLINAMRCFSCPYEGCDKQFVFPAKLRRHMKIHQGYPCEADGCGEILSNWSQLRKHKATVHGPSLKCNTCGFVFTTKSNLTQHYKTHSSDIKPVQCTWDGCERTFQYEKNMKQHIRSFHKSEIVFRKRPKVKETDGSVNVTKKPRAKPKAKKTISLAARIFDLDDRGKELKYSGRPKSESDQHEKSSPTPIIPDEEESTTNKILNSANIAEDVPITVERLDNASSTSSLNDKEDSNQREKSSPLIQDEKLSTNISLYSENSAADVPITVERLDSTTSASPSNDKEDIPSCLDDADISNKDSDSYQHDINFQDKASSCKDDVTTVPITTQNLKNLGIS